MKQALVAGLLRWTGVGALHRRLAARRRVTIVVYHDPDPATLRRHLEWYARHYQFTTLDTVADALETGRWEVLPPYPLVLTFDDGHRANTRLDPLFREFGVRPTVYLCSAIVGTAKPYWWQTAAASHIGVEELKHMPDAERRHRLAEAGDNPDRDGKDRQAMSWEEVRRLGAVVDFGAHTRTHPILLQCDDDRCADEIARCRDELEMALGGPCRHFAFPNGDFGEREMNLVRRSGYRTARTIDPGTVGPDADPLRLAAIPVSDDATTAWLAVQVTGLPALLRKLRAGRRGAVRDSARPTPVPAA